MSAENALKLIEKLKSDSTLQEKLRGSGASGFQQVAKDAGFDVTPQEFAEALQKHVRSANPNDIVFTASDGIVSGISSGVTSGHVSAVGSGII